MSYKSRGCWSLNMCLKECGNRTPRNCEMCVRFSKFKDIKWCECNVFAMPHKRNKLCQKQS